MECFCGIVAAQETIIMISDQVRQRAEKSFKQKERARDGRKAMTEYDTQALAPFANRPSLESASIS